MSRIVFSLITLSTIVLFLANNAAVAAAQSKPTAYAFVDVNVVTIVHEEIFQSQTVLVVGGRIVAIGPVDEVDIPPGAVAIEGADRYLMPGLIDAHLHLVSEHDLPLLLAHGVTTVRNMNGRPFHLAWRDEVTAGERLGPRIITAGPMLGELPAHLRTGPNSRSLAERVAEQAALGYDFIKVGDGLTLDELETAVAAAAEYDLDIVGHMPDGMRFSDLLDYGLRSVEHLDGLAAFQPEQVQPLLKEMADQPVWIVPTLTIWQRFQPVDGQPDEAQLALIDYLARTERTSRCLSESSFEHPHSLTRPSQHRLALVAALHEADIPLVLGTDAPFLCTSPGESIHQELNNFVDAGLSPYEALRTATHNPAAMLHLIDELGTVEVGKRADLLLLARNPMEDVSATRDVVGVMVRGQWLAPG